MPSAPTVLSSSTRSGSNLAGVAAAGAAGGRRRESSLDSAAWGVWRPPWRFPVRRASEWNRALYGSGPRDSGARPHEVGGTRARFPPHTSGRGPPVARLITCLAGNGCLPNRCGNPLIQRLNLIRHNRLNGGCGKRGGERDHPCDQPTGYSRICRTRLGDAGPWSRSLSGPDRRRRPAFWETVRFQHRFGI